MSTAVREFLRISKLNLSKPSNIEKAAASMRRRYRVGSNASRVDLCEDQMQGIGLVTEARLGDVI